MTTASTTLDQETTHLDTLESSPAAAAPAADPLILGVPSFLLGSTSLGVYLLGYVTPAGQPGIIPMMVGASFIGLFVAAVWAASLGESVVACVLGLFSFFWLSFTVLLLGLTHDWFALPADDVTPVVALFLISWLVVVGGLTVFTLRLPVAFTAIFALVELALAVVLATTLGASASLNVLAGVAVLAFVVIGLYVWAGSCAAATGGTPYPLGRPILR